MKTLILTAAVALLTLAGTDSADAGGCYSGWGNGYYNNGFYGGGHIHHNVNPNPWLTNGHYDWHNTSHYDYVPPRLVPHGNHFHVQPGGYYLHQTGHWDLHH